MAESYRVGGMTCQGCARNITGAITRAIPGTTVEVDLKAGTITVGGAAAVEAVRQAVTAAGFDWLGA